MNRRKKWFINSIVLHTKLSLFSIALFFIDIILIIRVRLKYSYHDQLLLIIKNTKGAVLCIHLIESIEKMLEKV